MGHCPRKPRALSTLTSTSSRGAPAKTSLTGVQAGHAAESVPGTRSWNSEAMMAELIYSAIASADGYIEDPGGSIDWGMPDEELLGFINELERPARTYLYGRRMYEGTLYW